MQEQILSNQCSMQTSNQARRGFRLRPLILSVGLALIALLAVWAVVLAYNTTTDFPQCEDSATSPSVMSCNWVNGNMPGAFWVEGAALPQKIQISGLQGNATVVHSYTWSVSWSDNTYYHGYDWLVSYAQAQQLHQDYIGAPLNLNVCTSGTNAEKATCNSLRTGPYSQTINIPDDTFVSGSYVKDGQVLHRIQTFESKYGDRTMTVYSDLPFTGTSVITYYHAADSSGFPAIANGGDTGMGQTLIRYTIFFTTAGNSFMAEYATHFAISGNPYVDDMAWGWDVTHHGYGASGLGGSNWHVKDPLLDSGAGNIGSQDNQSNLQTTNLYPIESGSTWNPSAKYATDTITMTTSSNDHITGTISFWVCADTTIPYTDTLTNGCTSTNTATFVGNAFVTFANKTAHATSPVFMPSVSGRYCFLTIFTPALNGNIFNFGPTADTNGTTECFLALGPNAITLSDVKATAASDGAPMAALLLSLLAIVAGMTTWRLGRRRRPANQ